MIKMVDDLLRPEIGTRDQGLGARKGRDWEPEKISLRHAFISKFYIVFTFLFLIFPPVSDPSP